MRTGVKPRSRFSIGKSVRLLSSPRTQRTGRVGKSAREIHGTVPQHRPAFLSRNDPAIPLRRPQSVGHHRRVPVAAPDPAVFALIAKNGSEHRAALCPKEHLVSSCRANARRSQPRQHKNPGACRPRSAPATLAAFGKTKTTREKLLTNQFAQLRLLFTSKPRNFDQRTAFEARPNRGALKAFLCGAS